MKKAKVQGGDPNAKYVDRFIRRLGLRTGSADHLRANVETSLDGVERATVLDALTVIEEVESPPSEIYGVLWQSARTARVTWPLFHRLNRALLLDLAANEVGHRIVDVGAGIGVTAAFLAAQRPDRSVVAIEPVGVACDVLRGFARDLGLSNLQVIEGQIEDTGIDDQRESFDAVVCTLVLGEVTSLNSEVPRDPWSTTSSVRLALEGDGAPPAVRSLAGLVAEGGRYLGLERAVGAVETARWLGWLHRSGLSPVRMSLLEGDGETVPFVEAIADGHAPGSLYEMALQRGDVSVEVELALQEDPPRQRLIGYQVDVEDQDGPGATRIEALVLRSGATVVTMSTSRGYRGSEGFDSPAMAIEAVQGWISSARADRAVVSVTELPLDI